MDILHTSTPITFYGCQICGITIRVYSVSPILMSDDFHPQTLTQSLRFYHPLPYPYTWYVLGEEAATVNGLDLQAYEETHRHPPSHYNTTTYHQPQQQEAIDGDGYYSEETHIHTPSYYQPHEDYEEDEALDGDYSHESVDGVAILEDLNMDQIMNDSFQQASDEYVVCSGLTKKQISKNLRVTKYDEEESVVCVVCQVEFEKNERVGVLQCRHRFHPECIKEWLLRKNVCPLCKNQALKV